MVLEVKLKSIVYKKYSQIKHWEVYVCHTKSMAFEIILVATLECGLNSFLIFPRILLVDLFPLKNGIEGSIKQSPIHSIYKAHPDIYHYFDSSLKLPLDPKALWSDYLTRYSES